MAGSGKKKSSSQPDFATIGGLVLAVGGILAGFMMEGGKIQEIAQITAALIVLGGTIGAVMVTTPLSVLIRASKQFASVVFGKVHPLDETIEEIVEYAGLARKNGIVSLEQQATAIEDPFLSKALNLAVDGIEAHKIREIMELEITLFEQRAEAEAKVFEGAGGYAPTIGIIGAVLGLIQVMKNLANIDEVGRGIAVAFVATVYGVGSANVFFLPAANKLRARFQTAVRIKEMMLDGVLCIAEGMNPKLIRSKLEAYAPAGARAAKKAPGRGRAEKEAAAEA